MAEEIQAVRQSLTLGELAAHPGAYGIIVVYSQGCRTRKAKVLGVDPAKFAELAAKAKTGCPVSKLLNAKITLDATLVN